MKKPNILVEVLNKTITRFVTKTLNYIFSVEFGTDERGRMYYGTAFRKLTSS